MKIKPATFATFDGDDRIEEWWFGTQGTPDAWRVMHIESPKEGVFTIENRRGVCSLEYAGAEAILKLASLLREGGAIEDEEDD